MLLQQAMRHEQNARRKLVYHAPKVLNIRIYGRLHKAKHAVTFLSSQTV